MHLLGRSHHEQSSHLGRKSKEMLMTQGNSQVLLKPPEGECGPSLCSASLHAKDILGVSLRTFCLLIKR